MKKLVFVVLFIVAPGFIPGSNMWGTSPHATAAEKGLVAQWKFDEGKGEEVRDYSGNALTGEVREARWEKGVSGYALSFNSENKSCVVVEDAGQLNPSSQITIEIWFKTDKAESDKQLLNKIGDGKNGYRMTVSGGKICWQIPSAEKAWSFGMISSVPYPLNEWVYVAGTYDGKAMRIYINGKETGIMERTGEILNSPRALIIGDYNPGGGKPGFNGLIDEIRIYNRALTAEEIQKHQEEGMKKIGTSAAVSSDRSLDLSKKIEKKEEKTLSVQKSVGVEEGLVGYWKFDKDDKEIADLSGNGNSASVTGGKIATEEGKKVLQLDGSTRVEIPSNKNLNLRKGFTIETNVKISDLSNGHTIVYKENEYLLRVNWPVEGTQMAFFVFADNKWEPRVNAMAPEVDKWYHIIAIWDGFQSTIWVNGQLSAIARTGTVKPTDNPVCIGCGQKELVGSIEYVKIYNRALTGAEIIKKVYKIEEKKTGLIESPVFDFKNGIQSWTAKGGALVSIANSKLQIKVPEPGSFAMNESLNANIDRTNYMSIRMTVDKGSTGNIIFATTKGASKVPFQIFADGKMHSYVFEPWKWNGWGGNLVALGIDPSEIENAMASIESIKITEDLQTDPELSIERLLTDSTLPRSERPEKIFVKFKNMGGTATNIKATLKIPEGVSIKSPVTLGIDSLDFREEKEVSWMVETSKPLTGGFQAEISGDKIESIKYSNNLTFLPNLKLPKASYVPEPKPVKGKYNVWMHYCPLWKEGTHYGWGKVEPWPERKPVLGFYNEGTPDVADWHIKYMVEHGISGVVYCWYRSILDVPVTVENQHIGHAVHDGILKAKYLPMIKFAIMWENGCGAGARSVDDLMKNVFPFWIDNYFSNPSYLKVDGKPVLYVWVPGNVKTHLGGSDNVRKAFSMMREECKKRGLNGLYIVGCVGNKNETLLKQMADEGWDASSSYGFNWAPTKEGVIRVGDCTGFPYDAFMNQQEDIVKFKNNLGALPDIAGIFMGWDARPWRSSNYFFYDNTADKFKALCLRIKAVIDSKTTSGLEKNTIIFSNWTEFGEGHYIEPTRGYGFSYVDAIRDVFTDAPKEHLDIAPEDVGLGPYDSWYQQAKARAGTVGGDVSIVSSWTGDKLGLWKSTMGLSGVEVKDGILSATSVTNDPAFGSPALNLRCNKYSKFVVEMRLSKPSGAQIFWKTAEREKETESASTRVSTIADGEFHQYVFEVGKNEFWGGALIGLRFDPCATENTKIEIRSIKLE